MKDILGQELEVGDKVVIPRGPSRAYLGEVIKLCDVMVKVRYHPWANSPATTTALSGPDSLVKVLKD